MGFTKTLAGMGAPEPYLVWRTGQITGVTFPITGESAKKRGAFFIKTAVAEYKDAHVSAADVVLHVGAKQFHLRIDRGTFQAFNGSFEDQFNSLSGNITVNGASFSLPIDPSQSGLDPAYDQAIFSSTYACAEDLYETVPAGWAGP